MPSLCFARNAPGAVPVRRQVLPTLAQIAGTMGWFSSGSRHEREQVLSTVRSLGTTSIPGLSAALAWPERRTQKVLEEALREGPNDVRYDPVTRAVRWVPPAAPPPAAPSNPSAPTAAPEVALPRSWTAAPRCASCSTPLAPTGTGTTLYCPSCGRLRSGPAARATPLPAPAPRPSPGTGPAAVSDPPGPRRGPPPPLPSGPPSHDRRAQELLAAWMTARPIPCPRCRTTLRHRGVAEYTCPACGEQVRFERTSPLPDASAPARPAPAAAAPPAPARP